MIVPGSNLLNMALGVIGAQGVEWRRYTGMVTTPSGVEQPTWAAPVTIAGSIQPVDAKTLQQLGLDWTQNYVTFYASAEFREIERDQSSDRISYAGRTYQIAGKTAWFHQDGWDAIICIEVPDA